MSDAAILIDAASRRRSPATIPGYSPGVRRATRGRSIRPTLRAKGRSCWSCDGPVTIATACALER